MPTKQAGFVHIQVVSDLLMMLKIADFHKRDFQSTQNINTHIYFTVFDAAWWTWFCFLFFFGERFGSGGESTRLETANSLQVMLCSMQPWQQLCESRWWTAGQKVKEHQHYQHFFVQSVSLLARLGSDVFINASSSIQVFHLIYLTISYTTCFSQCSSK